MPHLTSIRRWVTPRGLPGFTSTVSPSHFVVGRARALRYGSWGPHPPAPSTADNVCPGRTLSPCRR